MWQSPNKDARDKAKEFAARVACLISRYDPNSKAFVDRGVKIFMIIDGIWDAEDIRSLLRFGSDRVFYPDEIDKLVAAVGSMKGIARLGPGEAAGRARHDADESESDDAD
jgi:hypothetical protein